MGNTPNSSESENLLWSVRVFCMLFWVGTQSWLFEGSFMQTWRYTAKIASNLNGNMICCTRFQGFLTIFGLNQFYRVRDPDQWSLSGWDIGACHAGRNRSCGCLSENSVALHPMVLLIIIPTKWLFFWGYTPFSDIPIYPSCFLLDIVVFRRFMILSYFHLKIIPIPAILSISTFIIIHLS